jgi:hypothetical protein
MSNTSEANFSESFSQVAKLSDSLKKMIKLYRQLSLDRTTNFFKLSDLLKKIETTYKQIESGLASLPFERWLTEERTRLDDAKGKLIYDFGRLLEELLSKSGFRLEGNFPEFKVKLFLLETDMQTAKCKVWYGHKEEFLNSVPLNPESLHKAITSAYNKIARRNFDDARFIESLYQAYSAYITKQHKQMGDEVGIIDILLEMNFQQQNPRFLANPRRNTFEEYPREYFSYDLFRLRKRETNDYALSLGIATREQNRRRESYLWIPSDESLQGNVYSRLSFRRRKT